MNPVTAQRVSVRDPSLKGLYCAISVLNCVALDLNDLKQMMFVIADEILTRLLLSHEHLRHSSSRLLGFHTPDGLYFHACFMLTLAEKPPHEAIAFHKALSALLNGSERGHLG